MSSLVSRRVFISSTAGALAYGTPADDRIDRENLLLYRDQTGNVKPVHRIADWLLRRAEILEGMQQVMGRLPGPDKRCPLELHVEEEADAGNYIRRLVTYSSEPNSRVPAYLLIPKPLLRSRKRAAAIVCLHPTDDNVGHKVVVGLGGRENRQYASELAERGYVTLAPAYPLLANYQPDWQALGYESGTMKAIWDNIRGLDLLATFPFVRSGAFGAIGHSLGGHNSVYTAVFDERIRVIVSSCGLDSYVDYKDGNIQGWTSMRYMPKLLAYADRLQEIPFDFHEMVGALAPRVCLLSAPVRDDNFQWQSVDRVAAAARKVYQLYGRSRNLIVEHPDAGHDFPDEVREQAYSLFDKHLR